MICAHCRRPLDLVESNRPDVDFVYGEPIDVYECSTGWCQHDVRIFVPHDDPDGLRAARGITNGLLISLIALVAVVGLIVAWQKGGAHVFSTAKKRHCR